MVQRRLLVVDDSKDQCDVLRLYFSERGCLVETAMSGEEAIKMAPNVDGIVMDTNMLGKSGYDACKEIRLLPSGNHIVIVGISELNRAYEPERYATYTRHWFSAGADFFFTKSEMATGEDVEKVRQLMRERAERRRASPFIRDAALLPVHGLQTRLLRY